MTSENKNDLDDLPIHTLNELCQSCAMPISDESKKGTNKDGTLNENYCKYCYQDGEFTEDITMQEMKKKCLKNMVDQGMNRVESLGILTAVLPSLERWKE